MWVMWEEICCQEQRTIMQFIGHYTITFTFTFMHLADAFIQSDLHCIQGTVLHFISSCFPWEYYSIWPQNALTDQLESRILESMQ